MKQSIQFSQGRKLFLALMTLVITVTTSAQQFFEDPLIKVKKIDLADAFNKIEVRGNAVIVLTNDLTNSVVLRGDAVDLEQATTKVKNGKLIINASKGYYTAKLVIYLPAGTINSLATAGTTEILSNGTVKVSGLEILLSGSSRVSIRHEGKLKVTPATGYEIAGSK